MEWKLLRQEQQLPLQCLTVLVQLVQLLVQQLVQLLVVLVQLVPLPHLMVLEQLVPPAHWTLWHMAQLAHSVRQPQMVL